MANNPFDDHLVASRGRGARGGMAGGSVNNNRNRGGPGGGGNNRPNNRHRNRGPGGGLGAPDLPVVDAGLGLDQVNTGQMGGGFALGAGTPYGPGAGSTTVGATYSDKTPYEQSFFKDQPEAAFKAFLGSAGLNADPAARDLYGQWLFNQQARTQREYEALAADAENQNLSYLDYLGSLGGVGYGQPGWEQSQRDYWRYLWNTDTDANRGIDNTRFQGQGRWLAW